jgi:ATP/maltotriose-dependent transcriptional regulator MalT/DNA-binding SARP family transcriptional activator
MICGRVTKLIIPVSANVLPRARLFEQLDKACRQSLVWIGAVAGAGKSTLAASYLQACGRPRLWYRLDEGDNDPVTLYRYLEKALRQQRPRIKLDLPKLDPTMPVQFDRFTRHFFRALYTALKPETLIVFDDYRHLDGKLLQDTLRIACEEIPPGFNILVTSRHRLPGGFALLQSRQQVACVTWDDLRFSDEEVRQLLWQRGEKDYSETDLSLLCERSGGWVSALILILMTPAGGAGPRFTGTTQQQMIFDLFESEIIGREDEEIRRFLFCCTYLPVLTAALANEVSGRSDAEAILQRLVDGGMFTFLHPGEETAYTFHPLFKEFLQQAPSLQFDADEKCQLLKRIAQTISETQPDEAIQLWSACKDWTNSIRLILEQAESLISQGRTRTLEGWLLALPGERLNSNPWLLYRRAQCSFMSDMREARHYYHKAFEAFVKEDGVAGSYLSWAGEVDCINYALDDFNPIVPLLERFDQLRKEFPRYPSLEIRAKVTVSHLFATLLIRPNAKKVKRTMQLADIIYRILPIPSSRILIGGQLGNYYGILGRIDKLASVAAQLELAMKRDGSHPLMRIHSHVALALNGWVLHHNRFRQHIEQGLQLAQESGIHVLDNLLRSHGVYGSLIARDLKQAQHYLNGMRDNLDAAKRMDIAHYHYQMGWLKLLLGEGEKAEESLKIALQISTTISFAVARCMTANLLCQIFAERGDETKTAHYLKQARESAETTGSIMMCYVTDLTRAWIAILKEDQSSAEKILEQAYATARKYRITATVGWRPEIMGALCQLALNSDIETEYIIHLIRSRGIPPGDTAALQERWPWTLQVYTLGRIELHIDGKPVDIDSKSQRRPLELLKAIIALGGRQVATARLLDALWPEAEADAAFHSLESTLHRLRKLVGKEQVQMKNGLVSINRDSCWIDALCFDHICSKMSKPDSHAYIERTLALYQGAFLPGEEAPWALAIREQLASQSIRMTEQLADSYLHQGDGVTACAVLERGLGHNSLSESLYRRLIACYIERQEYAAAKHVYQRCEEQLLKEFDLLPSAATRELIKQIPVEMATSEAE